MNDTAIDLVPLILYVSNDRTDVLLNALRELTQKITLHRTRKQAREYEVDGRVFCPAVCHKGDRFEMSGKKVVLNRCHVGKKRADLIREVMEENKEMSMYIRKGIKELLIKVFEKHNTSNVPIVFGCRECNAKLEH